VAFESPALLDGDVGGVRPPDPLLRHRRLISPGRVPAQALGQRNAGEVSNLEAGPGGRGETEQHHPQGVLADLGTVEAAGGYPLARPGALAAGRQAAVITSTVSMPPSRAGCCRAYVARSGG